MSEPPHPWDDTPASDPALETTAPLPLPGAVPAGRPTGLPAGPAPRAPLGAGPALTRQALATRPAGVGPFARPAAPWWPVRIFATIAVAAFVTTYVAVEVDLLRRHFPGIDPVKYWLPQLRQITLPGLGAAALCSLIAFALHRLRRRS